MEDIFKVLSKAEQLHQVTEDLIGKSYGLTLAIVADVEDPLALGRVRVLTASKGAKSLSDWLARLTPSPTVSVPAVQPGDTVVVGYFDGDPHQGVYLGVLNNATNRPAPPDKLVLSIGSTQIVITDGTIDISGMTSVKINGKEVATVGAKDSRGDTLVVRGW